MSTHSIQNGPHTPRPTANPGCRTCCMTWHAQDSQRLARPKPHRLENGDHGPGAARAVQRPPRWSEKVTMPLCTTAPQARKRGSRSVGASHMYGFQILHDHTTLVSSCRSLAAHRRQPISVQAWRARFHCIFRSQTNHWLWADAPCKNHQLLCPTPAAAAARRPCVAMDGEAIGSPSKANFSEAT